MHETTTTTWTVKKISIMALTFHPLPRSVDRAVCDARQIPSPLKF